METLLPAIAQLATEAGQTLLSALPHVAGAAVVAVLGYQVSNWAVKYSRGPIARTFKRDGAVKLLLSSLRLTIIFATAVTAVSILGVDLTPLLAGAGVLGVVLGVTLAPLLQRQLSGFFVMSDKLFEVGDKIEILGMSPPVIGFVDKISMTSTRIKSTNGTYLTIPNSTILSKDIINYTAEEAKTKHTVSVFVTYESDVDKAMAIMLRIANETEAIRTTGTIEMGKKEVSLTPSVFIKDLGQNGIELMLSVWSSDPMFGGKAYILKRIYEEFKANGVEFSHARLLNVKVRPHIAKDYEPALEH